MKTSKVEIEPNVLSIIPMESKIDKNKKTKNLLDI